MRDGVAYTYGKKYFRRLTLNTARGAHLDNIRCYPTNGEELGGLQEELL